MKKTIRILHILNSNPIVITSHATMQQAAILVSESQVSDLMVVDQDVFIGVVSEGDLIRVVIPNFEELIEASGRNLANAFNIFLGTGKKLAQQLIDRLIIHDPITLAPEDELLKAAVIMTTKQIRLLPVVQNDKLMGTVSRADICRAILAI